MFFLSQEIDYCCISDNYWLGKEKPCLTYGLRNNNIDLLSTFALVGFHYLEPRLHQLRSNFQGRFPLE